MITLNLVGSLRSTGLLLKCKPCHMRVHFLFIAAIAGILTACSLISRTVNNIREPRTESPESVIAWLRSQGIDNYEVFSVEPQHFFDAVLLYQRRKLIFNRLGKVAELGANNTGVVCHIRTPDEVRNLRPGFSPFTEYLVERYRLLKPGKEYKNEEYTEETDTIYYNIDSVNQYLYTLDGKKASIEKDLLSDYTVIIPFAKYYGTTFQTADIKKYLKAIHSNKHSRFKVILLNLDKQAWWGKEWNEKIQLNL